MTLHDRREATNEATPAETAADINDLERNDLQRNDLEGKAPEASPAGTYRDEPATGEPVAGVEHGAMSDAGAWTAPTSGRDETAGQPDPAAADGRQSGDTAQSADWRQVLLEFVDHPREAVEKADRLVDDAVRALTERINKEHSGLRDAWRTHGEPSTEDLRKALRGYRDFFEKILSSRAAA